MRRALLLTALCLTPAVVAGTGETMAPKPHEAVQQRFDAIRRNNTRAFLATMFSQEQIRDMGAAWDEMRREEPNEAEAAQFAQTMAMLTAPGAEDQLFAMVQPQLAEMRQQMPMMIGMFGGMIQAGIQQDENLTDEEKRKAAKVMQAVTNFLTENDLSDENSAKKAIGILCGTARKLNVKTMQDLQRLNFDGAMGKADILLAGIKDLFRVYGVDFDQWIDDVETETITQDGDTATVRVHYTVFGITDSVDEELVRQGRSWISVKVAEALAGN